MKQGWDKYSIYSSLYITRTAYAGPPAPSVLDEAIPGYKYNVTSLATTHLVIPVGLCVCGWLHYQCCPFNQHPRVCSLLSCHRLSDDGGAATVYTV